MSHRCRRPRKHCCVSNRLPCITGPFIPYTALGATISVNAGTGAPLFAEALAFSAFSLSGILVPPTLATGSNNSGFAIASGPYTHANAALTVVVSGIHDPVPPGPVSFSLRTYIHYRGTPLSTPMTRILSLDGTVSTLAVDGVVEAGVNSARLENGGIPQGGPHVIITLLEMSTSSPGDLGVSVNIYASLQLLR